MDDQLARERRDADLPQGPGRQEAHPEQPRQDQPHRTPSTSSRPARSAWSSGSRRWPATLDKDKKVDYGVAPMPTKDGGAEPQTFGVTDYLMAFKKPGNQDAVKAFYDLYYQPDQVNAVHQGRGLPAGHQVRHRAVHVRRQAEDLPRDPAERAPDADRRPHLGQGQARRPAEPRRPPSTGDPKAVLDKLQQQAEIRRLSVTQTASGAGAGAAGGAGRTRAGAPPAPRRGGPRRRSRRRSAPPCCGWARRSPSSSASCVYPAVELVRASLQPLLDHRAAQGSTPGSTTTATSWPTTRPGHGAHQHPRLGGRRRGADHRHQPRRWPSS